VFTNLWLKRESLRIDSNLSGYLYSSVRNRILDYFAHHKLKLSMRMRLITTLIWNVGTDYRVRENQLKLLIELEIAELPSRTREVFEMSRNQHFTRKEIAKQLGTSEETIKNKCPMRCEC